MRPEPVKYAAAPVLDGCEPLRVMVMVCDCVLEVAAGASELAVPLAWFACFLLPTIFQRRR